MLFNTQPALKQTLKIFEQQKQVIEIRWAGLKLPRGVPVPSRVIFCMHQQTAYAGDVGSLCGAQQSITQQRLAQAIALVCAIHREPSQNHDRHGVTGQAFHDPLRCRLRCNTANSQAVEANHRIGMAANISLRAVCFLVDQRMALQKLVQRDLPTIERINMISRGQFSNR